MRKKHDNLWAVSFTWLLLVLSTLVLTACSLDDPEDESLIVGTGFRGTVSDQKQLASIEIRIKAQSGESDSGTIEANGQYVVETVKGSGPWLLRIDIGNDTYRYGIAYAAGVANVHSYSDVILRSWFLQQHGIGDLDGAFESTDALPRLPTVEEFFGQANRYFAVVELVLKDYALEGTQLLNDDFRTNDTGIDRYLNLNPVLVDGRQITIVKTDPKTNIQTSVTTDILLGSDAGQIDEQEPSMPEGLRALTRSSTEIILVWEPSTDNTAIIGYDIVRNGKLIAISPYPTYTDTSALPNTSYTYEVKAIDTAGNRSVPASVNSSDRPIIDNLVPSLTTPPPPAPYGLEALLSTTQRVELAWSQDAIGDVAGFNVYRGTTADNPSLLLRVTSTTVTDATITSAQEYYYQIAAFNAAGTTSARTEPLLVRTTGIVIEPPEQPVSTVPALAGLRIPDDINALACDATFPAYDVIMDLIVSAGCYSVNQDITVDEFAVLTLQPGVVMKFAQETGLSIGSSGALKSVGTAQSPIIMTGERAVPGWWRGVTINRSDNALNVISHTVVQYTGSDSDVAAVTLISSENRPAQLRLDNSLLRYSSWYGFGIPGSDARLESFRGNLITQNQRPAYVQINSLAAITEGSDFIDNDLNFIYVPLDRYTQDLTINDPGLPLQIDGIDQLRSTIIINEGVEMYFTNGSAFKARGNLAIRGTAANPVLLTSKSPESGNWQGLQLVEGANVELNHVIIEKAGQANELNTDGANLYANDARVTATNVTLRGSSSYGYHEIGDQVIVDKAERISSEGNAREDITKLRSD